MDYSPNSKSSTNSTPSEARTPDGWTLCIHPQGWIYFYNPVLRVVTDQDIRDDLIYGLVTKHTSGFPLSNMDEEIEVQLHVQTHLGLGGAANFNLAVNHKYCVAAYEHQEVTEESVNNLNPNTLNRRRRLYWNHLWNHPAHVPTPYRAITDAVDALTWYYTDNLISGPRSVVPFSKTECEELSQVVRDLSHISYDISVSKTVFLSWLLREVCSFRDSEYYGQHTQKAARTLREARMLPPTSHRPRLALLMVNLLSSEYRGRLANVQQNWERYIERLIREYSDFLLISTVLLSATVGFLAIPELSEAARVAATVSALSSLGSIIVGVFSMWRHRANTGTTANSFTYMHNVQFSHLGLHGHAVLLSLPPVFLVWAIVTFTVSVVAYTIQGLTEFHDLARSSAWTIMGIFFILLLAVTAALYTFSIIWKFRRPSWRINRFPWRKRSDTDHAREL